MSVHWKINGISACRSPLTRVLMRVTTCSHKSRTAASLIADIAAFREMWGETDTIEVIDGVCDQQGWVCCCEEACDCDEQMKLSPELEAEYARQCAQYCWLEEQRAEVRRRHIDFDEVRFLVALPEGVGLETLDVSAFQAEELQESGATCSCVVKEVKSFEPGRALVVVKVGAEAKFVTLHVSVPEKK